MGPAPAAYAEAIRFVRRLIWATPADGTDFPGAGHVLRIRRDTFDHLSSRISKEVRTA